MGLFMVSVRTRFAGLHRPDSSIISPFAHLLLPKPQPTGRVALACDGLEVQIHAKTKERKQKKKKYVKPCVSPDSVESESPSDADEPQ